MERKTVLTVVLIILALFLGFWIHDFLGEGGGRDLEGRVMLQQIDQVLKLVTVEGRFGEIYDYTDYWGLDVSPLRKKILIRVTALVSVGLDVEKADVRIEPSERIVFVENLPAPEILSMDIDLDYYDITEGTFNSFSEEDFTRFQKETRELIRRKVGESDLLQKATDQVKSVLSAMDASVRPAGWEIRY